MDSAFKKKLLTSFNELQNAIQENEEKNCVQLYKPFLFIIEMKQNPTNLFNHFIQKSYTNTSIIRL
jgi:hypothetical protein